MSTQLNRASEHHIGIGTVGSTAGSAAAGTCAVCIGAGTSALITGPCAGKSNGIDGMTGAAANESGAIGAAWLGCVGNGSADIGAGAAAIPMRIGA